MWFSQLFKTDMVQDESKAVVYIKDDFDSKYKTIIAINIGIDYIEILDWINKNSKGLVHIQIHTAEKLGDEWIKSEAHIAKKMAFIGFQNSDDALYFKIKYSV